MTTDLRQLPLLERPPLDQREGLDVHAVSIPARTFTGDFWFTHRATDRLWFALGDVAGKGLSASLVMVMIQEELEERIASCARAGCDPSTTMNRLHVLLRPLLPQNRFATAVIGWLRDDGVLRLTSAGHCPPLILRSGGQIEQVSSTGPVIGILDSPKWRSATFTLAATETLLLYSDGVTEAESPEEEEFGLAGIQRTLKDVPPSSSSRKLGSALLTAVRRHSGQNQADDLTMLIIKKTS